MTKKQNMRVSFKSWGNHPIFILNDKNLSWKAKGIMMDILFSMGGEDKTTKDLAQESSDGIYSTKKGLNELLERGYLEYV